MIDLSSYIDDKANFDIFIDTRNGLDVYVYDKDFAYINRYESISFIPPNLKFNSIYIDDISLIGHYHPEDLLYLLINLKKEKEKMFKRIDNYIKWKADFVKVNQGELKNNNV